MIDIKTEKLITLSEAARYVPRRRRGRKVSVSTIYRWAAPSGLRGIRLETIRVGGSLCTSTEALQRFFECLTVADLAPGVDPANRVGPSVEKELADYGL